jgi:hypothetical protein
MKGKDFGQFLEAFSEMLAEIGPVGLAQAWRELLPIFNAQPLMDLKDICKIIAQIDPATVARQADLQSLVSLMWSLKRCLGDNAKKAFIDDLTLFANALGPFGQFRVADLTRVIVQRMMEPATAPARRPGGPTADLIKHYMSDLESALGDDARFSEIFKQLKNDRDMKAPLVKQLAKEFAGASEKTKESALYRILARHESLVGTGARAKATGGRTAA